MSLWDEIWLKIGTQYDLYLERNSVGFERKSLSFEQKLVFTLRLFYLSYQYGQARHSNLMEKAKAGS